MTPAPRQVYSDAVGGVNFKGEPLPSWEEFSQDPDKQTQADGYRAMARHALGYPGEMHTTVVHAAVDVLNRAFAADPNAIHALVCNRVPCNDDLAEDPTIVAEYPRPINDTQPTLFQVGALGLINGIIGEITGGLTVACQFSDKVDAMGASRLVGFQVYNPSPETADGE